MRHVLGAVFGLAMVFGVAHAGDKKGKTAAPPPAQKDPMAEAMAKVEKLATPGEGHKALRPMVGKWKTETSMWMDPSKPPQKETGTVENKLILGDRFLATEHTGQAMGKPFKGQGLIGFDNAHKKYQMHWIDSMTTCMLTLDGTADASGKVITFAGEVFEPMFDKNVKQRWVVRVDSDTKYAMEFYMPGPDGKEMKTMEIQHTRVP